MPTPDALLLLTESCPFCPTVLQGLSELVKTGLIGRLEVVNIEAHPEVAREHGVRSVPWVRLGPFELDGLRSKAELETWAKRAGTNDGLADYFNELLASGGLHKVLTHLHRDASALEAVLVLLTRPDTNLHVQLGIGAIMEDLRGTPALRGLVDQLAALTTSDEPRLRGDAAHYLALSQSPRAVDLIRPLLKDADSNVREIAADSLHELEKHARE
ncbi:MAG: HEAT repeat domain-containing protein [Pseudomonadota bacterium]|nr:MAG: HEAT repeat domain-containing protein [Pseudomonadota bacterium]